MMRLGLIGFPLDHSLSPKIHNAALKAGGLEGSYSLIPVPPHGRRMLEKVLSELRSGEQSGLNVTIPHKMEIIPFLDGLTPVAQAIGAVNTIFCRNQKLIGDNTDAPAFLTDLKRCFSFRDNRPHSALIFGASGAARAVAYSLSLEGWEVNIFSRRMEAADQIAAQIKNTRAFSSFPLPAVLTGLDLVVNATPLGMEPDVDKSPWPEGQPFPDGTAVYDLVYTPRQTRIVREAQSQGLRAVTGLGMLVEQAALAFELWTGELVPRESLFESVSQT